MVEPKDQFAEHVGNDLNVAAGLGVIFDLVRELNAHMDATEKWKKMVTPIRTEADYKAALKRISYLMTFAQPGTDDGNDLDVLVDLVQFYEMRTERMPEVVEVRAGTNPLATLYLDPEFRRKYRDGLREEAARLKRVSDALNRDADNFKV